MNDIKKFHEFESRWCIRCGNKSSDYCTKCYEDYLKRVPLYFDVYCECKEPIKFIDFRTEGFTCRNCFRKIKNDKTEPEKSARETLQPE